MLRRAEVLTPWTGDGSAATPFRPLLAMRYAVTSTDITAQPAGSLTPDPNLTVLEIVCEESVLAQIDADPDFEVLTDEPA